MSLAIIPHKEEILRRVALGERTSRVLDSLGVHDMQLKRLRDSDAEFAAAFAEAEECQCERLADQLMEIPEDERDVQRARLVSDNVKWLLARRARGKYGDKVDVTVTQHIDIRTQFEAAERRLRSQCDQQDIEDVQVIDTQAQLLPSAVDNKSTVERMPTLNDLLC